VLETHEWLTISLVLSGKNLAEHSGNLTEIRVLFSKTSHSVVVLF